LRLLLDDCIDRLLADNPADAGVQQIVNVRHRCARRVGQDLLARVRRQIQAIQHLTGDDRVQTLKVRHQLSQAVTVPTVRAQDWRSGRNRHMRAFFDLEDLVRQARDHQALGDSIPVPVSQNVLDAQPAFGAAFVFGWRLGVAPRPVLGLSLTQRAISRNLDSVGIRQVIDLDIKAHLTQLGERDTHHPADVWALFKKRAVPIARDQQLFRRERLNVNLASLARGLDLHIMDVDGHAHLIDHNLSRCLDNLRFAFRELLHQKSKGLVCETLESLRLRFLCLLPSPHDRAVLQLERVSDRRVGDQETVVLLEEDVVDSLSCLLGAFHILRACRLKGHSLIATNKDLEQSRANPFNCVENVGRDERRTALFLVTVRQAQVFPHGLLTGFSKLAPNVIPRLSLFALQQVQQGFVVHLCHLLGLLAPALGLVFGLGQHLRHDHRQRLGRCSQVLSQCRHLGVIRSSPLNCMNLCASVIELAQHVGSQTVIRLKRSATLAVVVSLLANALRLVVAFRLAHA